MKESIEEAASHVVHDLERYLNSLGTIAAITPLLGLLGTVMGMIKVFAEIMAQGTGNASVLAGGISEALVTTAAGLSVAIPALALHRYFTGKIDAIVVELEQESIKLVDALYREEAGAAATQQPGAEALHHLRAEFTQGRSCSGRSPFTRASVHSMWYW